MLLISTFPDSSFFISSSICSSASYLSLFLLVSVVRIYSCALSCQHRYSQMSFLWLCPLAYCSNTQFQSSYIVLLLICVSYLNSYIVRFFRYWICLKVYFVVLPTTYSTNDRLRVVIGLLGSCYSNVGHTA